MLSVKFFLGMMTCGLYYKPMTIVSDDSRVVNKLETALTDNARVVIYDNHMFIVQATGCCPAEGHYSECHFNFYA
jgi:hypothetical protein